MAVAGACTRPPCDSAPPAAPRPLPRGFTPIEATPRLPDDPGYRNVERTLPTLRYDEANEQVGGKLRRHLWQVSEAPWAEARRADPGALVGRRVLVEGKMVLVGSEAYPSTFKLGPFYEGCVHLESEAFDDATITVSLPAGQRVLVTDRGLLVEGVLAQAARGEGAFVLRDAKVERLPSTRPPAPAHKH